MNTDHCEEEVRTGEMEPTPLFPPKAFLLLELMNFGGADAES